jgi:DNA-binding XRE family transcriptional regulator
MTKEPFITVRGVVCHWDTQNPVRGADIVQGEEYVLSTLPIIIRDTRKRLGLSADKFAELLGFTSKNRAITIYRWETGKRHPSPTALKLLREVAGNQTKRSL